jgi:branched-chain amino acid transport system ATP-binding protein
MALLSVENLRVCYGDLVAVRDVSFAVEQSDVFVLLGANGAGKTSILRCISGLHPSSAGRVTSGARTLSGLRPHSVALAGIAHVPEGRRVFSTLTVEENLTVSFIRARADGTLIQARDKVYDIFARLKERRSQAAGTLSGGEQQMLAIGRALMNAPTLLMLDEPSIGLSPLMAELMFERLSVIRAAGTAILLVEQNAACLEMATQGLVIANGSVVLAGDRQRLHDADFVRAAYLGL